MKNNINKGGILVSTLVVGLVGVISILSFYSFSNSITNYYNVRIAKMKAFYNAETGMARKGYEYLWKVDFIEGYDGIEGEKIDANMGY